MAADLSAADIDAIADAVVRKLVKMREAERAAKPRAPEKQISETDRAAARAIARRLGLHVRTGTK